MIHESNFLENTSGLFWLAVKKLAKEINRESRNDALGKWNASAKAALSFEAQFDPHREFETPESRTETNNEEARENEWEHAPFHRSDLYVRRDRAIISYFPCPSTIESARESRVCKVKSRPVNLHTFSLFNSPRRNHSFILRARVACQVHDASLNSGGWLKRRRWVKSDNLELKQKMLISITIKKNINFSLRRINV